MGGDEKRMLRRQRGGGGVDGLPNSNQEIDVTLLGEGRDEREGKGRMRGGGRQEGGRRRAKLLKGRESTHKKKKRGRRLQLLRHMRRVSPRDVTMSSQSGRASPSFISRYIIYKSVISDMRSF